MRSPVEMFGPRSEDVSKQIRGIKKQVGIVLRQVHLIYASLLVLI